MKKNFNKGTNFLDPHSPSPLANPRLIYSRSSILNFRTMDHMQLEPKLSLLYSLLYSYYIPPYYIPPIHLVIRNIFLILLYCLGYLGIYHLFTSYYIFSIILSVEPHSVVFRRKWDVSLFSNNL